jgi:hypothetical protein
MVVFVGVVAIATAQSFSFVYKLYVVALTKLLRHTRMAGGTSLHLLLGRVKDVQSVDAMAIGTDRGGGRIHPRDLSFKNPAVNSRPVGYYHGPGIADDRGVLVATATGARDVSPKNGTGGVGLMLNTVNTVT